MGLYEYEWIFWLVLLGAGAWLATSGRTKIELAVHTAVQKRLSEAGASEKEQPGYVRIKFPTYAGAFVVVTEFAPEVWVPSSNARSLINQLSGISLKFGLLTLWAPYVLLMLGINYITHLGKLRG